MQVVSKVHSYYRQGHLLSTMHPLVPSEFLFIFHISAQFQQVHFKLRKKIFLFHLLDLTKEGEKFCRDTILTQAYAKKKKKKHLAISMLGFLVYKHLYFG